MVKSNNYTVIRLSLAMSVLYSHSFALTGQIEPSIFNRSVGAFAVHCFFAISGYLIAGSYINSISPLMFVSKRIFRIAPALILAYGFSLLLAEKQHYYLSNPVKYIADGPVWTLPWEIMMYMGVLFLGILQVLDRRVLGSLFLVSLLLLLTKVDLAIPAVDVIAPMAILFLAGAFLRLSRGELGVQRAGICSLAFLLILFLHKSALIVSALCSNIPLLYAPSVSFWELRLLAYLTLLPIVVIYVCEYAPVSFELKRDYSYGVYVFAWPIQQTVVNIGQRNGYQLSPFVLFSIAGTLTILVAALSWHLVEKPAIRIGSFIPRWTWRNANLPGFAEDRGTHRVEVFGG